MKPVSFILIGAGGHAGCIIDILHAHGDALFGYVDPKINEALDKADIAHVSEDQLSAKLTDHNLIMGFVGLTVESLKKRHAQMQSYKKHGASFPAIVHPSAIVSETAKLEDGAQIMAGAIVNAGVKIGAGVIVNSGALIEHDAVIGAGSHIAPRAVVLGGANVGNHCFIGANATVIQGTRVPPETFVKAQSVYRVKS